MSDAVCWTSTLFPLYKMCEKNLFHFDDSFYPGRAIFLVCELFQCGVKSVELETVPNGFKTSVFLVNPDWNACKTSLLLANHDWNACETSVLLVKFANSIIFGTPVLLMVGSYVSLSLCLSIIKTLTRQEVTGQKFHFQNFNPLATFPKCETSVFLVNPDTRWTYV